MITPTNRNTFPRYPKTSDWMPEPYQIGGKNRYVCPRCGRKGKFTRYINVATGLAYADEVGICAHVDETTGERCYNLTPAQWIRAGHRIPEGMTAQPRRPLTPPPPPPPQVLLPDEVVAPGLWINHRERKNVFVDWLFRQYTTEAAREVTIGQKIAREDIVRSLASYCVGVTRVSVAEVVFYNVTPDGKITDGKIMAYGSDGHRLGHTEAGRASGRGGVDWVAARLKRDNKMSQSATIRHNAFFGGHLATENPDKVIVIVESEKTALIGSFLNPRFVWMASGGLDGLNSAKFEGLRGRRVVLIPDADGVESWKRKMTLVRSLTSPSSSYVDIRKFGAEGKQDIADVKGLCERLRL